MALLTVDKYQNSITAAVENFQLPGADSHFRCLAHQGQEIAFLIHNAVRVGTQLAAGRQIADAQRLVKGHEPAAVIVAAARTAQAAICAKTSRDFGAW